MRDQFGQAVPADLVVMPLGFDLNPEEVEAIDVKDWYECRGILLVAQGEFPEGDDPRDFGIQMDSEGNIVGEPVLKIDRCLHRHNNTDGFYHA